MKVLLVTLIGLCLIGCGSETEKKAESKTSGNTDVATAAMDVEAACGQCKFGLGKGGCDLAVRVDGKAYFVDGSKMSDHGDEHGPVGMCKVIREATVQGKVVGDRFKADSFKLKPITAAK